MMCTVIQLACRIGSVVAVAVALGTSPALGRSSAPPHTGVVTGAVYVSGGPAPTTGAPERVPAAARVVVRDRTQRLVARVRTVTGSGFRFTLRPGTYTLATVPQGMCTTPHVRVRAGKTTHVSIVCRVA
jgi:hypothetical protein